MQESVYLSEHVCGQSESVWKCVTVRVCDCVSENFVATIKCIDRSEN